MFRDKLWVSGIPPLRECILMLHEVRYGVIETSGPFESLMVMNQPFRPVGQSRTSFQVIRGTNRDINHPRTGKRGHVGERSVHLRAASEYLGFPPIRRNMKTFCSFLGVGIAWFLVTMKFR